MAPPSASEPPPKSRSPLGLGRTVPSACRPVGAGVDSLLPEVTWTDNLAPTLVPPLDERVTRRSTLVWDDVVTASRSSEPELETMLGEGGMGAVWLGTQAILDRKVAVKTLRDRTGDPVTDQRAALELLREARVTGALEHPNVVPVYDVRIDRDGLPLVLLKRIQGQEWASLMHDEAEVKTRFGDDLLEWNLKVLIQVCNAVSFAHSRGILHRDLKPTNVMIGEFGQVYLLDWGIAVGLNDDVDPSLPRVSEIFETAGTPSYMAPEMVAGASAPLSERTDVYLLGAILFHIVTGRAPHKGSTLLEVFERIRQPVVVPEEPPEVRAILERALAVDPDDRYPTVEALRRDVSAAVSHGDASRLAADAERELERLVALIEAGADNVDIRRRFSTCRFGFRASLMAWPENPRAREGLLRCVEKMLDHELAQGLTDAAAALASEIEDLPDTVRARVEEAVTLAASEQSEAARLAQLGRSQDKRTGQGTRLVIATILGSIWTIAPLTQLVLNAEEDTYLLIIGRSSAFVVVLAALAYRARETMLKTALNRHLIAGMGLALVSQIFLTVGGVFLGLRPEQVAILGIFVWFAFTTMIAITSEPRLWPTAVAHLAAFMVAAFRPEALLYAGSAAKFALTVNALAIWRPEAPPRIAAGQASKP